MKNTRIYTIWKNIKSVCYDPNDINYENYGGKGVRMFDEWKNNFESFYQWAIYNGYNDELELIRIDINLDFRPENCMWVTQEQLNNSTYNNIKMMHYGERTIEDIARIYNEDISTIYRYYYKGMLDEFLKSKQDAFMAEFCAKISNK